jgi:hypothetical protein
MNDWNWENIGDHIKEILALLIIGGGWIFGLLFRAFAKKSKQQQGPQQPRQAAPRQAAPAAAGPDPMNPRDEVQGFLDKLRRQAEEAAAMQQRDLANREQARPVEVEKDEWIPLDFDDEAPARPQFVEPRRQAPPPAPRRTPVTSSRPPTFPDQDDEVTPVAQGATSALSSSSLYFPPGELQLPTWITLEELSSSSNSGKVLGVPIRDAILINEILAPPRALRPLRPGGGAPSTRH